jgi:hypothetical protein
MVADALAASEVKVTVRLLPTPSQVPPTPPLTTHEMNVVAEGRLSATVIEVAASGPLLVIVIV